MPFNRSFPLAIAAAAILSLSGCATSTANLSTASVGAYRDTIDLNGKIGATYQHNGERGAVSSPFTWTQRPGRIDVTLFTPLRQTAAEISVTADSATLTQPNREPRVAKDIDTLTQQALGWSLPVAGLRDWLQGYAIDAQGKRFAASPANNSVVTNEGWRLRYVSWQDRPAGGAPMPLRIDASRGAQANGDALDIHVILTPES